MSYAKMAFVYDILMEDAPYEKWEEFTEIMFHKYGRDIQTVADLGCGTGQITRRLAEKGYQMVGVDYSEEMLSYAQQQATNEKLSIGWFKQDVRALEGFHNYDAVVSFCDVINYITNEQDLSKVFGNVNHMLRDRGLFVFDIHSIDHIEQDLKGQTFAEIYDDISYVWFCQPGEELGEVFHDLTFFVLDEKQYDRFDETHHQRTFSIQQYERLLTEQGFVLKGVYADFTTEETSTNGERLFFICEKNEAAS